METRYVFLVVVLSFEFMAACATIALALSGILSLSETPDGDYKISPQLYLFIYFLLSLLL